MAANKWLNADPGDWLASLQGRGPEKVAGNMTPMEEDDKSRDTMHAGDSEHGVVVVQNPQQDNIIDKAKGSVESFIDTRKSSVVCGDVAGNGQENVGSTTCHKKMVGLKVIDPHMLSEFIRTFRPNFLFLIETLYTDVTLLTILVDVRVVFIRRAANSVAHYLVRASSSFSDRHSWGLPPLHCIISALEADFK